MSPQSAHLRVLPDPESAPEPPFDAGTPDRAPKAAVGAVRKGTAALIAQREATAEEVARRLGIAVANEE